jgi:protein gp37
MNPEWVIDLRDQCRQAGVPFFFKQWGGKNKKQAGRVLEERVWNEMPRVSNRRKGLPVLA